MSAITPLLAALAVSPVADVQTKIVGASLFKNGYAVVFRELEVTSPDMVVTDLPQSALGTFWMWTTDGLKIREVVNTTVDTPGEEPIGSLDDLLSANVGKRLKVAVRTDSGKVEELEGELLSAAGSMVVMLAGETTAFPKGLVLGVRAANGTLLYKRPTTTTKRVLRMKFSGTGKLTTVGLERGLTWAPGYALDISDAKRASLTAKATVLNDLGTLDSVETRFVTGFPNVPWAQFLEPLLSGHSVDQFTGFLNQMGNVAEAKQARGREVMTQNMPAADFGGAFEPSYLPGVQAEDLFFYRQPNVSLKRGDRGMYVMFTSQSDYSHLYTLDLPETVFENERYVPVQEGPLDVWHGLRFKNTSGQPLTTAAVTVFKDAQVMGQDTLRYTSVSGEVLVKMNKALDVRAEQTEEEVTRGRVALKLPNNVAYDLVTLKGTVSVRNAKPEAVSLKMTKSLTGEIVASDGKPEVTSTAKGLRQMNPTQRLVWQRTLDSGKELKLTYTYRLYVRSEGY